MKRILTICLALLIVCTLSINTAFAQDVRQKPVVKKQTTTTTKQTVSTPACQWELATSFKNGEALVVNSDNYWYYIDKTGKVVK